MSAVNHTPVHTPSPSPTSVWQLRLVILSGVCACLTPLLLLYIVWRIGVQRRPMRGLREKFFGRSVPSTSITSTSTFTSTTTLTLSSTPTPQPATNTIMVHGVSMGEVMLMKPLIPLIEQATGGRCVLSTSTSTGALALEKNFPDNPRCFFPFDLPWAVHAFLSQQKPRMVILLELELWPLFLCACFARNIPVLLVNARVGDASYHSYRRLSRILRPFFAQLQAVLAQNAPWGARLRHLGCHRVFLGGSLKADIVSAVGDDRHQALSQRLGLGTQPLFLIASTSDQEEDTLLASWLQWEGAQDWRIVICPRHPERGAEIQHTCERHGLGAWRSTAGTPHAPNDHSSVVIVDEIGCLGALYALADIAAVGGSFGSGRHGQNMLEAAAAGTCTVVGWDTSNQPDSMAMLRQHAAVIECTPDTISEQLIRLATDPAQRQRIGNAGRHAWMQSRGAAQRSVDLLVQHGIL